jgi:Glycerophosphoryl diester phosphodiesterase family
LLRTLLLAVVLNIADQGGVPENTSYAYREAVRAGADMLAVDVQATRDGRLVAMRDPTVDRTTDGTGHVSDLTLAQLRRLDAAHHSRLQGVRTGERHPPRGYTRRDFRVPVLSEILRSFPRTPLRIGIDDVRTAELLAALLDGTRRELLVISPSPAALDRFHELAPAVPRSSVVDLAQPTPASVLEAHRAGQAVHVAASGRYGRLLRMCVDGIVTPAPQALERRLTAVDPCSVRATRATVEGQTVAVGLERRGLGPQAYEGVVLIRSRGRLMGREEFSLAEGAEAGGVTVALTRYGRRRVAESGRAAAVITVRTRGSRGVPQVTRVRL